MPWLALVLGLALSAVAVAVTTSGVADARNWLSIIGFFTATTIALVGLILAKRGGSKTGGIIQENVGGNNIANTGQVGDAASSAGHPAATGDITQRNKGGNNIASTGQM